MLPSRGSCADPPPKGTPRSAQPLSSPSTAAGEGKGATTFGFAVRQPVHLEDEVILQEEEAHDGEEVDKDERQEGCQQDGAPVPRHAFDDIEQGLLTVDQVKQLKGPRSKEMLRGAFLDNAWPTSTPFHPESLDRSADLD